jgi:deazaflavin-dependent oxidoreductase (nitroreductase family)
MKSLFRLFLALQVALYRWSGGRLGGSMRWFRVLLLTTTGRKSGKMHTTPLGYFKQPDGFLIIASNSGQPAHPGWFFNLKANPHGKIQVMDKVISISAEILSGASRAKAWQQIVTTAPLYAKYAEQTTREIPVVLLRPQTDGGSM